MSYMNPAAWSGVITSVMGDPRPYGGHEGIDIAPTGSGPFPVVAAAAGKVDDAGYMPDGYGYYVKIKHDDGRVTLYGHFAEPPAVARGDKVAQGQQIGIAGSTGYSTGTHLHFSILENGAYLNPFDFVDFSAPGAVMKAAAKAVSDAASTVLQQVSAGDCYSRWLAGELTDAEFDACVDANLTDDERAALIQDATIGDYLQGESGSGVSGLSLALKDLDMETIKEVPGYFAEKLGEGAVAGLMTALNRDIIEPLKNAALNTITWPFRAMINTMQLSDEPLTTGAETVEWLQQPENQRLYIASQAALVLVLVLIVVAVSQFLREPAKTVVKTAANPVGAAADML